MRYAAILLIVISILLIVFPNYFSGREGLVSQQAKKKSNLFPPAGYYCPKGCGTCKCGGSGSGLDSCGELCCASSPTPQDGSKPCFKKCPAGQTSKGGGVDWDKCYPVPAAPAPSTGATHCFGSVCVTEDQVQAAKARVVAPQEVWGVNSGHEVYKRPGDGSGDWQKITGELKDVSVGSQYIWGVNSNDDIYKCKRPCTGGWERVDGGLSQIDAY